MEPVQRHLKSAPLFGFKAKQIAVIAGLTVIKDVVIVQSGVDKVDDYMDADFIAGIVAQGNASPDGVKCRAGHPNMCKEAFGTFLGNFHNFRAFDDTSDSKLKAIADLYLANISKKTMIDGKGISYHDYIVEMAKEHPTKFGNSIVFSATSEIIKLEDESEVNKLTLVQFAASDIVDSPAATDGLFKSDGDIGQALTYFLDEHGTDLFAALDKNPDAVEIFIKKYINSSSKNQISMKKDGILARVKSAIGKATGKAAANEKDITRTDADGAILTVVTEAQEAAVGDEVQIDGQPAPDDTYTFPEGDKWVIVDNKISEMVPADTTAPPPPPATTAAGTEKAIADLTVLMKGIDKKLTSHIAASVAREKEVDESLLEICKGTGSTYTPAADKGGAPDRSKENQNQGGPRRTPVTKSKAGGGQK